MSASRITVHGTIPRLDVPVRIVGELNPGASSTGPLNMFVFRRDYFESLKGTPGLVTLIWAEADSLSSIHFMRAGGTNADLSDPRPRLMKVLTDWSRDRFAP